MSTMLVILSCGEAVTHASSVLGLGGGYCTPHVCKPLHPGRQLVLGDISRGLSLHGRHVTTQRCSAHSSLACELTGCGCVAGIAEMLVMTMPAQGAHELGEVAHAHLSGCADSAVEEQAGTVCAHPAFGS